MPARPMKSAPADHRAADVHERFMDVIAFVESGAESSELMKQRLRLLHNIAEDSQPAAVRGVAPGQAGADCSARQLHSMRIGVVRPVTDHFPGFAHRRPRLAANRRDRIHQRDQLRHVMGVGSSQDVGQGNAVGIDDQMMF